MEQGQRALTDAQTALSTHNPQFVACRWIFLTQGRNLDRVKQVARQLRAGRIYLNGAPSDQSVPFGGYKQSGNGRECGVFGLEEYLEVKAMLGYQTVA